MQELARCLEEGLLTDDQWQFSAKTKPHQELYDTHDDPFQVHDLSSDPEQVERMEKMHATLASWVRWCDDPLTMPEDELVRTRVYPPDGEQPTTASPVANLEPTDPGRVRLTIHCETEGASIGYRPRREPDAPAGQAALRPWALYVEPVEIEAGAVIELVAHRLGFQPSPQIVVRPPE